MAIFFLEPEGLVKPLLVGYLHKLSIAQITIAKKAKHVMFVESVKKLTQTLI